MGLSFVVAYDGNGNIIATTDILAPNGPDGLSLGVVDFAAMEAAGLKLRSAWEVNRAVGSGTWPEWLGAAAHDFRVELEGKRIVRLIHRSGYVRHRDKVESAIARRVKAAKGEPVYIGDLVGGPGKPLELDEKGRTRAKVEAEWPTLLVHSGDNGKGAAGELVVSNVRDDDKGRSSLVEK